MPFYRNELICRFRTLFESLYGEKEALCLKRLRMIIGRYGVGTDPRPCPELWDESTSLLITYGDMVQKDGEAPLTTLKRFTDTYLQEAISHIHILPFFPYSSDDGFSVIDYREVNPDLGSWREMEKLGEHFELMFDLVLNHCSSKSEWFQEFRNGVLPGYEFFVTAPEDANLSSVVRPRTSPLLFSWNTRKGEKWVWSTFSKDQVDLDFSNPDVLFEFLDILLLYISKGGRILRLDAIAYLWKEIGTSCIHHPKTHEVVKLFRDVLEVAAPDVLLLTETNVPHAENVSYFGDGDEAHMVYQFSLPPLLLHALLNGDASRLSTWADNLGEKPENCTYLNFTASHDGIGVRPLEGLVPKEEILALAETVRARGGRVNSKTNEDGTESPYELNVTYFSALCENQEEPGDTDIDRFLCSQTIPLALQGIPALYFHSLSATPNDLDGMEKLGYNRAINRRKWEEEELNSLLRDRESSSSRVFRTLSNILKTRSQHEAFHPDGGQTILQSDPRVFALLRTAPDEKTQICCIHNVSDETVDIQTKSICDALCSTAGEDILNSESIRGETIQLAPYQCRWILLYCNGKS